MSTEFKIFTTLRRVEGEANYLNSLNSYFKKNDTAEITGCLIFQNNSNDLEPWIVGQQLLSLTSVISPLIAVNPIYMHPLTAAQKIASLTKIYQRRIYINFITGTSISDLESINGFLEHAKRYDRLVEYIEIINYLITNRKPLTYDGAYYKTNNLRLPDTLDKNLLPEFYIAGSSIEAQQARRKTNACGIEMAKPIDNIQNKEANFPILHFGIVSAQTDVMAYKKMNEDFAAKYDDIEEIFDLSMSNSDAVWKKKLAAEQEDAVYSLRPFKNLNADCPYLVGSYERVADYLKSYIRKGYTTFIVEANENELDMIAKVSHLVKTSNDGAVLIV